MPTQTDIQTAINSLLAIGTLRQVGAFPDEAFNATLYGAAKMPTEQEIITARNALQAMASLQVSGNFPEAVRLALLSIAADKTGGETTGGVTSVNGQTGTVTLTASSVGAEQAFTTLSDAKLGDRTAVDSTAPTNLGPGSLTAWLGWIANRIRAITGGTSWFATPATTLATTATHLADTNNPHATTLAQVANTSQTANNFFGAPNGTNGVPGFRTLAAADVPLATQTLRGAISRETSGTFTPALVGGTTAGANTYPARSGSYYLVGKICVATIYMEVTKDAAMAGNVTITGLPFTTTGNLQSAAVSQYAGVTFSTGYTQLGVRVEAGSTNLLLFQGGSGVGSLVLQASAIASSFVVAITVAYITA